MDTGVEDPTPLDVILKVADVLPPGTVTDAGSCAADVLLL